jgi:hypothetical protein
MLCNVHLQALHNDCSPRKVHKLALQRQSFESSFWAKHKHFAVSILQCKSPSEVGRSSNLSCSKPLESLLSSHFFIFSSFLFAWIFLSAESALWVLCIYSVTCLPAYAIYMPSSTIRFPCPISQLLSNGENIDRSKLYRRSNLFAGLVMLLW